MAEGPMDDSTIPVITPDWLLVSKNNTRLSYVRPIDAGGFGQVHEVRKSPSFFATPFVAPFILILDKISEPESGKVNTSLCSLRRCALLTTFLLWVGICSENNPPPWRHNGRRHSE
jgi:hypothetical protein